MNKKMLLILGVLVAVVALASGMTIAYAKGNGNNANQGILNCKNLVLGTVMGTVGTAGNGTITLLPRGQNTNQTINVNSDTKYTVWMAANQSVGFGTLEYGDWIAVCSNNGVANLVVELEAPVTPFYLRLQGNVTSASGGVISGNIEGGGIFTISGVSGNITGALGEPIVLNIGKYDPPAPVLLHGLNMKSLENGIGLWMRNHGWMMGR